MARVEACGGLVRCALLACLSSVRGYVLDDVDCKHCGVPFVTNEANMKPTQKHVCSNCGGIIRGNVSGVCNPLKEHLVGAVKGNVFADLATYSVDDVVACVATLGETLTHQFVDEYLSSNTMVTATGAHVSNDVAPSPHKVKMNKKHHKTLNSDSSVFGNVVMGGDGSNAVAPVRGSTGHTGRLQPTSKRVGVVGTRGKPTSTQKHT